MGVQKLFLLSFRCRSEKPSLFCPIIISQKKNQQKSKSYLNIITNNLFCLPGGSAAFRSYRGLGSCPGRCSRRQSGIGRGSPRCFGEVPCGGCSWANGAWEGVEERARVRRRSPLLVEAVSVRPLFYYVNKKNV